MLEFHVRTIGIREKILENIPSNASLFLVQEMSNESRDEASPPSTYEQTVVESIFYTSGVLRERRQQHTSHGSEVVYVDSTPPVRPRNVRFVLCAIAERTIATRSPAARSPDRRSAGTAIYWSRTTLGTHSRCYLAAPSIWLRFHRCGSNRGEKTHTRCAPRASPRLDLPRLLREETNVIGILDSDHGTLDRSV